MIVLGLIDSKPSSAALMQDGEILAAVAEERLNRWKMSTGTPRASISQVMQQAGIRAKDIDHVAIAQQVSVFEPEAIPWSGWFDGEEKLKTTKFARFSATLAPWTGRFPFAWEAHHQLKRLLSRERLHKLPALLRQEYGIQAPITFYDHHYCHATGAYYTSGFGDALVVTLDGGGDGQSGSVYAARNGRLQRLARIDSYNSLGNFYAYITQICGFKAENHEGKVTGLAALGQPVYADILRQFVSYEEPGQVRYRVPMYHRSALRQIASRLPADFDRADLAASVQLLLEEIGTKIIRYWLKQTGLRDLAVAGGVFANVKFNQRIHELPEVGYFFVHPAMDDSGLSVGSALAALAEQPGTDLSLLNHPLPHVYLGPEYSEHEIATAIQTAGLQAERLPNIQQSIAKLLAQGYVVARFTGRMEYGPRALGHRSILYQTADPSVNDWLNERLKRTEFMPFAPATLIEHARDCYFGLDGAEDPARFMTITFDCSLRMREQSPGVVHVDGTARPQLLDPDTAPDFYRITHEYYKLTGIPSLINTSFNMHGEPIVCSPEDALRSFQQGNLDYLAIGDWLVPNSSGLAENPAGNTTPTGQYTGN
jgi:carbamoyltransferase